LRPEKIDDFMAGEMRVNEHPFLTTMHIVFVREHNRIAKLLKEYLPSALHQVSKLLLPFNIFKYCHERITICRMRYFIKKPELL